MAVRPPTTATQPGNRGGYSLGERIVMLKIDRDGNESRVEICGLRKGDVFYVVDGAGEGPLLEAVADAEQRPSRQGVEALIWGCALSLRGNSRPLPDCCAANGRGPDRYTWLDNIQEK
jgi:hypothetical protein